MRHFKSRGFVFIVYFHIFQISNFPPFVVSSSIEDTISHSPNIHNSKVPFQDKMNHQMTYSIILHGVLLWVSMGFFMPLGIFSIRMANKFHEGRKVKVFFFYLHAISQILAVLLATAGAIMSLRTLENSFNNSHQRLGLALYVAMWLQFLTGVFKPSRGSRRRLKWYIMHWMFGTIVSLVGVINIYTGIRAYEYKTSSRDSTLWTVLFTVEIFCLILFYLFQDKWDLFQNQSNFDSNPNGRDQIIQVVTTNDEAMCGNHHKILVPQPSGKSNALRNLFEKP